MASASDKRRMEIKQATAMTALLTMLCHVLKSVTVVFFCIDDVVEHVQHSLARETQAGHTELVHVDT